MTASSDTGDPPSSSNAAGAVEARLLGAVLAGGRSRRFGRDKTTVPVDGVPMIERAVAALEGVCSETIVVSSRTDTPEGRWRIVPDSRPDRGPLAGIEAALSEAGGKGPETDGSAVLVLAADLPLVDANAARELAVAFRSAPPSIDAVAASRGGADPAFEPLFAVYRRRCLPVVARLLDEGRAAAQELFEAVEGRTVRVGGDVASVNVNTEEDLARAEARLAGPGEES